MGGKTPIGPNVTLVGIVYSQALGHVRQHVYAEHDHGEYDNHAKSLCPGETMCFVDIAHHHAGHDTFYQAIRDAVKAHGGVDAILHHNEPGATAHRYAQVDPVTKLVTHVTMADPAIDNVRQGVDIVMPDGRKTKGAYQVLPDGTKVCVEHKTLDELGYVNVPAGHPTVDLGHVYDPVTNTFSNPRNVPHPSKLKK